MADADESKTLEAKCFCGSVHLSFDMPVSSLPLSVYLCHCSLCRYSTGAPCIVHAQFPVGLLPKHLGESGEGKMTSYTSEGAGCSYVFCSTCGCHIGAVSLGRDQWTMATSIFADHGPENFRITLHVFSKSAKGGGISSVLTRMGDGEMKSWDPPDDDPSAKVVEAEAEVGEDGEDRLRSQCKCGGVSFAVRRPTQTVLDDGFMSKLVSPRDRKKWRALYDTCNDCRLTTGTHVVGWATVPLALCEPKIDATLRIGTAKTYSSSEGVLRSFCGVCGATVFYSSASRQPSEEQAVVDVATGILRAPEGPMAEDWLTWRERPAFAASGIRYDKHFSEALDEGMRNWTKARYGNELNMEVG
ncbi:DUF636 domain protein [Tolypocladium capitatum]|uniref:DUF636 domain protein n=1 Tax=Tolypocladium capitatum TaxID=45235 RepID=A0A2K3PU58_9HYPO|nr:DUF636 domain protein [Tolypocladium capitatum]